MLLAERPDALAIRIIDDNRVHCFLRLLPVLHVDQSLRVDADAVRVAPGDVLRNLAPAVMALVSEFALADDCRLCPGLVRRPQKRRSTGYRRRSRYGCGGRFEEFASSALRHD